MLLSFVNPFDEDVLGNSRDEETARRVAKTKPRKHIRLMVQKSG